jgi:hypothetical protein
MSVSDLGRLHTRYIELSNRFKAAWTFHQFLQGLQKITLDGSLGSYANDFQAIYNGLKDVSQNLNTASIGRALPQMEMVDRQLSTITRSLISEDQKVGPALLRQFFQRVKNYDDNILTQLLKFYLYVFPTHPWSPDQVDKADFLATKVGEEAQGPQGPYLLRDRAKVRPVLAGLWQLVQRDGLDEGQIHDALAQLEAMRGAIGRVASFDDLTGQSVIKRYRQFKHGLGAVFFEPEVLLSIVETNLLLRNAVAKLYRQEERRIITDYQQIFELEKEVAVDNNLDLQLSEFHQRVERFENQLQQSDFSVDDVANLRQQVRELMPRLSGRTEEDPLDQTNPVLGGGSVRGAGAPVRSVTQVGPPPTGQPTGVHAHIQDAFERILEALSGTDDVTPPRAVAVSPAIYPYRLEPREIRAFRRLRGVEPGDHEHERFVLQAAALRSRIQEEVDEIRGILDDSSVTREAPVYGRARLTTALASQFERHFDHLVDQAVIRGELEEAQHLLVLRMRLAREGAGLWLLVNKPY